MSINYTPRERDADGFTLKDRIWRYTCKFVAEHPDPPEWAEVKRAVSLPDNASESKQRSHYTAALHYMKTGTLPSESKTIPVASDDFVRDQRRMHLLARRGNST
ncbi:MAG: hypothetical protein KF861_20085 [Planctomycetaceae bacterium]|nr:hypothetical protein [Planctomycetaceae bacterium]